MIQAQKGSWHPHQAQQTAFQETQTTACDITIWPDQKAQRNCYKWYAKGTHRWRLRRNSNKFHVINRHYRKSTYGVRYSRTRIMKRAIGILHPPASSQKKHASTSTSHAPTFLTSASALPPSPLLPNSALSPQPCTRSPSAKTARNTSASQRASPHPPP